MNFLKNTILLAFVLTSYINIQAMLPRKVRTFTQGVKHTLLGNKLEFEYFMDLPQDLQRHIVLLLTQYPKVTTLKKATAIIRAFTRINKELNNTINNDPIFIEEVLTYLSKKFNCSKEEAATTLSIAGSKEYLKNIFFGIIAKPEKSHNKILMNTKVNVNIGLDLHNNTILLMMVDNLNVNNSDQNKPLINNIKALLKNIRLNVTHENVFGDNALHLALIKLEKYEQEGTDAKAYQQIVSVIKNILYATSNPESDYNYGKWNEILYKKNSSRISPLMIAQSLNDQAIREWLINKTTGYTMNIANGFLANKK